MVKDGKDGKFEAEGEEQRRDQLYAHNKREQFLRLIRSNLFSKLEKKEINDSYRTNRTLRNTIKDRVVFLFKLLGEVEDQKTNTRCV